MKHQIEVSMWDDRHNPIITNRQDLPDAELCERLYQFVCTRGGGHYTSQVHVMHDDMNLYHCEDLRELETLAKMTKDDVLQSAYAFAHNLQKSILKGPYLGYIVRFTFRFDSFGLRMNSRYAPYTNSSPFTNIKY